jgi:hypothetical protein
MLNSRPTLIEQERRESWNGANAEAEAVWKFLSDPNVRAGTTAGDMLASVARMLRNRATVGAPR